MSAAEAPMSNDKAAALELRIGDVFEKGDTRRTVTYVRDTPSGGQITCKIAVGDWTGEIHPWMSQMRRWLVGATIVHLAHE